MVRTALSRGEISRETIVCRRSVVEAAMISPRKLDAPPGVKIAGVQDLTAT
jgi:hypothetical protein